MGGLVRLRVGRFFFVCGVPDSVHSFIPVFASSLSHCYFSQKQNHLSRRLGHFICATPAGIAWVCWFCHRQQQKAKISTHCLSCCASLLSTLTLSRWCVLVVNPQRCNDSSKHERHTYSYHPRRFAYASLFSFSLAHSFVNCVFRACICFNHRNQCIWSCCACGRHPEHKWFVMSTF